MIFLRCFQQLTAYLLCILQFRFSLIDEWLLVISYSLDTVLSQTLQADDFNFFSNNNQRITNNFQ
jgi:hypothetical protein